ncbi:hypothetical protein BGZ98_008523 [Dissophora globulifera]|nr:hypothetical protein BGZ98_008523 [Dissophora globulifera]
MGLGDGQQDRSTPIQSQGQRRSLSVAGADPVQQSSKRRLLQLRGPWRWEEHEQPEVRSQSSVTTMTDITSVTSEVAAEPPSPSPSSVSSLSRSAPLSSAFVQQANLTRFFALTGPPRFYVAEPSAYLPLLVHEPRYLRPRRKKLTRGLVRARMLTPLVRKGHDNNELERSGNGTLTPDVTSPENSLEPRQQLMYADGSFQSSFGDQHGPL